jgi:hypothetical protein
MTGPVEAAIEAIEAGRRWPRANTHDLATLLVKAKLPERQRKRLNERRAA